MFINTGTQKVSMELEQFGEYMKSIWHFVLNNSNAEMHSTEFAHNAPHTGLLVKPVCVKEAIHINPRQYTL